MVSYLNVSPAFDDFIFDWYYEQYLLIGSYGSGKSYAIAEKIILKLLEERRKACVIREVYDSLKESTFDLIREVLETMDLLELDESKRKSNKVIKRETPLQYKFPNGSRIIFKGMDKTEKVKSLNGVSIVWLEECSEIKYEGYKEMLGRIRTPNQSMHFILSCNPVGKDNWVYSHFFVKTDENGKEKILMDENKFYMKKHLIRKNTYYHHSVCEDNVFLPKEYIKRLDELKDYDEALWKVARLGRFGIAGIRVLPQFEIQDSQLVKLAAAAIPQKFHRYGMDFGFETSYNAVVYMAVDDTNKWLYIYKEYYKNKMTDDKTAIDLVKWDAEVKEKKLKADCAEPKAIQFYRQEGFSMVKCKKLADKKTEGSRIANTKKCKRFRRIICASDCVNVIRELSQLTYKKDAKGNINLGQFNIDPHTFSAIWYGLDDYTVANVKRMKSNSVRGK